MNTELLTSLATITGIIGSFGFYVFYMKKTPEEIEASKKKHSASETYNDITKWRSELGFPIPYIEMDTTMLNALDSLAVYRYGNPRTFCQAVEEIEKFYKFFLQLQSNMPTETRKMAAYFRYSQQYVLNIDTLLSSLKIDILEKYQETRDPRELRERVANRTKTIVSLCNGYSDNIIKSFKSRTTHE